MIQDLRATWRMLTARRGKSGVRDDGGQATRSGSAAAGWGAVTVGAWRWGDHGPPGAELGRVHEVVVSRDRAGAAAACEAGDGARSGGAAAVDGGERSADGGI